MGSKLLIENVFGFDLEPWARSWMAGAGPAGAATVVGLLAADVFIPIPSSVISGIALVGHLLPQRCAIESEQLRRFHLIAVGDRQRLFDERGFTGRWCRIRASACQSTTFASTDTIISIRLAD